MTAETHGRYAPSEPAPYPGIIDDTRYAYEWNKPRKAADFDYDDEVNEPQAFSVSPLVAKYLERMKQSWLPLGSAVIQKIKEQAQEERSKHERKKATWAETPEGVEQRFNEQPPFIHQALLPKINWLRQNRDQKHINAFLMGSVRKALLRLDAVRQRQSVNSGHGYELAAYYFRRWPHLATFSKKQVITVAHEIAARLTEMFETECSAIGSRPSEMSDDDLLWLYRHLGAEMFALRVTPPAWRSLNAKGGFSRTQCYSSLLRISNPDWWGRKLWRLRCEWRENQFRAAGVIHKKRMPYVSFDALNQWQEQRRKNRAFFQSHDLVDDEGNIVSLEDMVNASVSNPAIRRHELMNRMSGVELVAQSRGDVGIFLTITCPSKYHSNIHSGHQNPKWNHTTARQGQQYLCKVWGRATSALKRQALRPYGFRVAEPHHDGTPHWHALLFMPQDQVKETLSILREYFIKEDRQELGRNTGARFKSKKMDPRKGSATAYVAKYISKNIDGYALDGELDTETGKSLKDTAKYAMAWASQHNIRQFQPFGQPPVTVWRELRKLSNQLTGIQKEAGIFQPGKQMLPDVAMDRVMAAADAGCFATYIEKQGGVLIPRECYTVRLAYEEAEEVNAYGESPEKIFGVFSPHIGITSRICTRLTKWKICAKHKTDNGKARSADAVEVSGLSPSAGGAWSSVNNSTGDQKIDEKIAPIEEIGSTSEPEIPVPDVDFDQLDDKERRKLFSRIKKGVNQKRLLLRDNKTSHSTSDNTLKLSDIKKIRDAALYLGVELGEKQAKSIVEGAKIVINGRTYHAVSGNLHIERNNSRDKAKSLIQHLKDRYSVDTSNILHDPKGNYLAMLKRVDPVGWERLFNNSNEVG